MIKRGTTQKRDILQHNIFTSNIWLDYDFFLVDGEVFMVRNENSIIQIFNSLSGFLNHEVFIEGFFFNRQKNYVMLEKSPEIILHYLYMGENYEC
ncbi:hypothetical protein D3C87_80680 [compost metagenome]